MSTNVLNLWTNQVGNSYCPQVKLEIWKTSEDATKVYYDWYMYYVTYGYAAYTNGYSRSVTGAVGGDTLSGSININGVTGTKLINSGSSWLSKQHSTRTVSCSVSMYFDVTWNGTYAEYVSKSGSFTIGAKTSYTVSYNANGGSGVPSNQTKWYGEDLTLSSTKPTRTGYSFKNWNTKADGSGTTYASGGGYTGNAALTLYAQWTPNTYTVKYNANGGTGAPANQTKTYGVDLTLSTAKPTRTNYNFLGWATSASATTVNYAAGATYSANSAVTLYAVWELAYWKPKLISLKAMRCESNGVVNEFGTYAKIVFHWSFCQLLGENITATVDISWGDGSVSVTDSGETGVISEVVGDGALSIESSYTFTVKLADNRSYTTMTTSIPSSSFVIDFKAGGTGVAFGKAASQNGFHSAWPATFDDTLDVGGAVTLGSTLDVGDSITIPNAKKYCSYNPDGAVRSLVFINSGQGNTYFGNGSYANSEGSTYYQGNTVGIQAKGHIYMTAPSAGLSARAFGVNKVLASTASYMNADQTITLSEAVSAQPNGIVLMWSWYNNGAQAADFIFTFVPKYFTADFNGLGVCCYGLCADGHMMKYVYVYDTKIVGHSSAGNTGTYGGVTRANANYVLRKVIGV